jgi:hypothetical protein
MTGSKGYPATEASSDVQITFREDLSSDYRQAAERSVATLIARSVEAEAQARAAEAELAKLTEVLNAPFVKLIEGDPGVVRAIESLRARQLLDRDATDALHQDAVLTETSSALAFREDFRIIRDSRSGEFFRPPYHFEWSFQDPGSGPPFNRIVDRFSGRVGLDARSGLLEGGAPGFVKAHAGFGVAFTTDHPVRAAASATLTPARWSYRMRSLGVGSNATTEGGVDAAAFEEGRLLDIKSSTRWRRRISGIEDAFDGGDGTLYVPGGSPGVVFFQMQPGRVCTVNVGIWVFSDRTPGVGAAAVQSLLEGTVHMSISLAGPSD